MSNRRLERDTSPGGVIDVYGYDSLYRLASHYQEAGAPALPANDSLDPILTSAPGPTRTYGMDGVGNRGLLTSPFESYAVSGSGALVNEYWRIDLGTRYEVATWDANGNLATVVARDAGTNAVRDTLRYRHDYRNRLVGFERLDPATGAVVASATYLYDALGRRLSKAVTVGATTVTTNYVLDGNQEIQERDGAGAVRREFVYGNGIDEPIRLRTLSGGLETGRFFYHTNSLGTVMALSTAAGAQVERYRYDPHGTLTSVTSTLGAATLADPSPAGNPFFFTARRLDTEELPVFSDLRYRLYFYRARSYLPTWGRFIERDPVALDDLTTSSYAMAGSAAPNRTDPAGLWARGQHAEWTRSSAAWYIDPNPWTLDAFGLGARFYDDQGAPAPWDSRHWLHATRDASTSIPLARRRHAWVVRTTRDRAVGLARKYTFTGSRVPYCQEAVLWLATGDHTVQDFYSHFFMTANVPLGQHWGPEFLFGLLDIPAVSRALGQAGHLWKASTETDSRYFEFVRRVRQPTGFMDDVDFTCCIRWAFRDPSEVGEGSGSPYWTIATRLAAQTWPPF